jgi:hypothetical protein
MRCVSIVRSSYFRIFSASFFITFLFPEIATSINVHVSSLLPRIMRSSLLLGVVLSVWICWFHSTISLDVLTISLGVRLFCKMRVDYFIRCVLTISLVCLVL